MLLISVVTIILLAVRSQKLLAQKPDGLKLNVAETDVKNAPRFGTDVRFDPYPSTINVENRYDCNADSLRVCILDDPTTLFGCKELAVRCQHFASDTEYRVRGTTRTIPKNATPQEGYALAVTTLMESCNPYHGDPVLVAANADSNEYMLLCQCKEPGYIGNVHLLGACDTAFVCDGKVDSIDKPLNKIECKCGPTSTTKRYGDGMPACKKMLVREANERYDDWSSLVQWNSPRLLETKRFNPTVRDNVRSRFLLNPCTNSLHDTSVLVPNASFREEQNTCRVFDYGYPVRSDLLQSTKPTADQIKSAEKDAENRLIEIQPTDRVDANSSSINPESKSRKKRWMSTGFTWLPYPETKRIKRAVDPVELKRKKEEAVSNLNMIDVGAVLATGRYNRIRFTDNISSKRKLAAIETTLPNVPETANLGNVMLQAPEGIGISVQLLIDSPATFVAPRCSGSWPSYNCYLEDYFRKYDFNLPRPGERGIPSDVWFPWNQEQWYRTEELYRRSVLMSSRGFAIDQEEFTYLPKARTYGIEFWHRSTKKLNGVLSFGDEASYQKHFGVLT